MEERCKPLNSVKKKYIHILKQIPTNDKDLLRIIATNPVIMDCCIKAEGFVLLIEQDKMSTVVKELKKYGYLAF